MVQYLNDVSQIWWQWMGSMFWQVSLLIIIVTALDMAIRKWAWPQVRYALWALVFIKLVISPAWQMPTSIVSWLEPRFEEQITVNIIPDEHIRISDPVLINQDEENTTVKVQKPALETYLLLFWFTGIIIFSAMLIWKMVRFRKSAQKINNTSVPVWFSELVVKTAGNLRIKKAPSVIFTKEAKSPAVYGVFRPILLMPSGYLENLSKEEAEYILIHELCHLKRGDLLVHWLCICIQIVYWFNPLLIWSRRHMRHICEICCDLSVANILREKTGAYRETLLKSARALFRETFEPGMGFLGIFEEPFRLIPRLKWLEKRSWEKRKRRIAITIFANLFMVLCVMPMAGNSQTSDYNNDNIAEKQLMGETDFKQDMVYYESLIMELDIDKEFDFDSSPTHAISETIFVFNEGLVINGKSLKDIGELFRFMLADSDVNILSRPQIMTADGESAVLSITDNPDERVIQNLTITPKIINEMDYVTQNIKIEIIRKNKDDPATNFKKTFENTLITKDGKTVLIKIFPDDIGISDEEDQKPVYIFISPSIIRKTNVEGANTEEQNSSNDPRLFSIDFNEVDITAFIKFISEITGKKFIIGEDVKGKVSIKAPSQLTVEETYRLFESVLEVNGYAAIPSETAINIVKAKQEE